jgi:hypothetical protein
MALETEDASLIVASEDIVIPSEVAQQTGFVWSELRTRKGG